MTAEIDNFVVEHLRLIRGSQERMDDDMLTVKDRLAGLERATASIVTTLAEHSTRMDRVERRLDRIEKRLDLVEV